MTFTRVKGSVWNPEDQTFKITSGSPLIASSQNTQEKLQEIVSVKDFGALGDNSTDDTSAIQSAIDYFYNQGGGTIFFPQGIYRCRDLILKNRVSLFGLGRSTSKLRFYNSGDDAADAASYVIQWQGAYNEIIGLVIDGQSAVGGGFSIGNGLYITPDVSLGYHRRLFNCSIEWFAGYLSSGSPLTGSPVGTYGINQNYDASDIVNGSATKLQGGNCIRFSTGTSASEVILENLEVGNCDGYGLNLGTCNDSKFHNIYVRNCMYAGIISQNNAKNHHYSNIKVYLSRRLNVRTSGEVIPFTSTGSDSYAAVVLSGAGHVADNFETQENGAHGFMLGTNGYSLSNSQLKLFADGNGGYTSTVSATDPRYGVLGYNYYGIDLKLLAANFKARVNLANQSRSFHAISAKPTYTNISNVVIDNYYIISDPGSTLDVTDIQESLATTSNAQDFIFQASYHTGSAGDSSATIGDGELSAVNGYSKIDIEQSNMKEVLDETGTGYNVDNDILSEVKVNSRNVGEYGVTVLKFKSSTQSISSTTSETDITDLQFTMKPNEEAHFEFYLYYDGPKDADIKFDFSIPSGASIAYIPYSNVKIDNTSSPPILDTTPYPVTYVAGTDILYGTSNVDDYVAMITGTCKTGTTGGTLKMRFKQSVSDGGNTRILTQSFARLTRGI